MESKQRHIYYLLNIIINSVVLQ